MRHSDFPDKYAQNEKPKPQTLRQLHIILFTTREDPNNPSSW